MKIRISTIISRNKSSQQNHRNDTAENVKDIVNTNMQRREGYGYHREDILVFLMKRMQMEMSMKKPIDVGLRQNVMEKKEGQIERHLPDGST